MAMKSTEREQLERLFATYDLNTDDLSDFLDKIEEIYHPKVQSLEERKKEFYDLCKTLLLEDRSNATLLSQFYQYWTEHSTSKANCKMRFEKQSVFDHVKRYKTWERNNKKFSILAQLNRGSQINPLK